MLVCRDQRREFGYGRQAVDVTHLRSTQSGAPCLTESPLEITPLE
jgi:hypothetical protein